MIYYIYENWQAGPHKAVIHRANCGRCNHGLGQSKGGYDRAHGKWHGPYDLNVAQQAQQQMDVVERPECQHCMKGAN